MRSHQEAFYQLRKTLGHQSSSTHSFTIKPFEYTSNKMIIAIVFDKVLEAGFTGLNKRAGDLLTVKFKYNTPAAGGAITATRIANLMHGDT